jgi:hypothetical protein
MVEGHLPPIDGTVTLGTLAWEVVDRLVFSMAVGAVSEAGVIKSDDGPILGDVTL